MSQNTGIDLVLYAKVFNYKNFALVFRKIGGKITTPNVLECVAFNLEKLTINFRLSQYASNIYIRLVYKTSSDPNIQGKLRVQGAVSVL